MRLLEECNADPDIGLNWDNTYIFPLTQAIFIRDFEIAETLLIKGAKVKPCHDILHHNMPPALSHPIAVAIAYGQTEMVNLMLVHDVPVNFTWDLARDGLLTPFLQALSRGDLELVRVLLDHGADVLQNSLTQLNEDDMSRYINCFSARQAQLMKFLSLCEALYLWPYSFGSALLIATGIENRGLMEYFLGDATVETEYINENKLTALHVAAGAEGDEFVEFLLTNGTSIEARDSYGATPLMHAVFYGNLPAVERFLSSGASADDLVDGRFSGFPLVSSGVPYDDLFDRLTKSLSEFAQFCEFRWTAIQVSSHRGFCKILAVLLRAGGDPFHQSRDGKTALDLAIASRRWGIVTDLLQLGVKFNATSSSVARLLDETSDDYNDEAACILADRGANSPIMVSEIKSKGLRRNTELLAILDEAARALLQIGIALYQKPANSRTKGLDHRLPRALQFTGFGTASQVIGIAK
ncbi:ankyrin [Mytilinidion resinicola]|uniref:Ankyrin n=1 Tax=Mytilinidion resinicola TaxID=574789 RepID=A0A6A6YCL7_9PEZI|nr:ankyrin [Mytilinidion resinicola]KAF2805764.1 ankyrin [Mytilinidion resinicola]